MVKTDNGSVKPILIMTVGEGREENPRYRKVIAFDAHPFKMYNLDELFIATNTDDYY